MNLSDFLLARIAEDEAWTAGDGGWYLDVCQECAFGQQPQSPYSRARVLAECDAKRRIVAQLWNYAAYPDPESSDPSGTQAVWIIKTLAFPYAGHADYDPAWRP
jgi:hypothetical protein